MKIANRVFENYTYVMAIINLTPDSFWKESRSDEYNILSAAERAIEQGAAVLDLGAQSTRPGYCEIGAEAEIARLIRPLESIKRTFNIPVSVDTYFPQCAKAALESGADMINDTKGLKMCGMAEVVAKHGAAVCIMHNSESPVEGDVFAPVMSSLEGSVRLALASGIDRDKICLDGGIGFAKNTQQNFQLLNGYERLSQLGFPLLIGTSRKSMFGGDVRDRLAATVESTRLAASKGVLFVRVHDVKSNADAIKEYYGQNNN